MAENKVFYEEIEVLDKKAVKIGFWQQDKCTYALVVPALGANLIEYVYKDTPVIFYNQEDLEKGEFTGCPVLFPTPNRVRGCTFNFRGKDYPQKKKGQPRFLHGLVYDEAFVLSDTVAEENCVWTECYIDIDEKSELYQSFPFSCRLTLRFSLKEEGLCVSYCLENKDEKDLPFGFGIHPYFYMPAELDRTVKVDSELFLEVDGDILPSGRLLPVFEHFPGLSTDGVAISSLVCDNDFLLAKGGKVTVSLSDLGRILTISASSDFGHLMVYRPKGADFICIENQTCSIDAHNLYSKGLKETSGLLIVPPGQEFSGFVSFSIQ